MYKILLLSIIVVIGAVELSSAQQPPSYTEYIKYCMVIQPQGDLILKVDKSQLLQGKWIKGPYSTTPMKSSNGEKADSKKSLTICASGDPNTTSGTEGSVTLKDEKTSHEIELSFKHLIIGDVEPSEKYTPSEFKVDRTRGDADYIFNYIIIKTA